MIKWQYALGVIYERPELGVAMQTLLDHYGLKPRHPRIVHDTLRAASFDANMGRISLDEYHNAVLRVQGITEDKAMLSGREALRFDASRIELPSGTAMTLRNLAQSGLSLGAFVNSPYRAEDECAWLMRMGLPPELWTVFLSSSEMGAVAPEPGLMEAAIRGLDKPIDTIALVSHAPSVLGYAAENGLLTIAFTPTSVDGVRVSIDHLDQLPALVSPF
jgi:hypothetical protein